MNVKLIRILTGEEIIAEVLSETDDTVTVQNGLVVLPTGQNVGFAPWTPVISKENPEVGITRKHIVYIADVQSDVVDKYNEMFGSKLITTPKDKKLIL
jgi:hypothetical protein